MITEEIIVNGERKTIVVKIPDDLREEYYEDDLENTADFSETLSKNENFEDLEDTLDLSPILSKDEYNNG